LLVRRGKKGFLKGSNGGGGTGTGGGDIFSFPPEIL
jgi:hypothetical protein